MTGSVVLRFHVTAICRLCSGGQSVSVVLIVDDDEGTLDTFAASLRPSGFEVVVTTSVGGGVALVRQRLPEIMLVDLRLPDGSGLELVKAAREMGSAAFIIVMTGW